MYTVIIRNLRTGETTRTALFKSHEVAAERARRGNAMARACKMTHLVYRATWDDVEEREQGTIYCGTGGQFCSIGCQVRGEHRDEALQSPWITV